jgi:hypothetical protein
MAYDGEYVLTGSCNHLLPVAAGDSFARPCPAFFRMSAETRWEAKAAVRAQGWMLSRDGAAWCPDHIPPRLRPR